MENLVLGQTWGGLGDNLQFSTLPELYAGIGKPIYLAAGNVIRNPEIKKLVWDLNPHLKGVSNEPQNIGSNLFSSIPSTAWTTKCNIIKKWELVHGFNSEDNFPLPKIYYKPNLLTTHSDKIVADLTSMTLKEHYNADLFVIKDFLEKNYKKENIYLLTPSSKNSSSPFLPKLNFDHQTIEYSDIFEYADIIFSAKKFLCYYSGSMVLGAALRKNNIDCVLPNHPSYYLEHEMPYFYFPNVNYFETLKK
jgi:hypothetical protein